jgi:RNA polymerase sigma-70 factor, ECF subfamily
MRPGDSIHNLTFSVSCRAATAGGPTAIESEVMELFDRFRAPLLRYGISIGISVHDAEEIIQEVFLALFRHLQLGRSRQNLRGWIFRVMHNLALKQRTSDKRTRDRLDCGEEIAEQQLDPSPSPEEHLSQAQRQRRLLAVVQALSDVDQSCLRLRAEGLRYREIAAVLGISLGSVSASLTRSLERLARVDGR